jgi:hypothetical protein
VRQTLPPTVVVPVLLASLAGGLIALWVFSTPAEPTKAETAARQSVFRPQPRDGLLDESGFTLVCGQLPRWDPLSLEDLRRTFHRAGYRGLPALEARLRQPGPNLGARVDDLVSGALLYLYEGEPRRAYPALEEARHTAEEDPELAAQALSTIIFLQGVAGLRRGETENCVLCRGASSCIFPIDPQAVHANPAGSRLAVRHFTEYLRRHPDDLGARWLLNVAHMTLGEYPAGVPPEYLLPLDRFRAEPQYAIGKFREISTLVGVSRLNRGGGAIMEDFDNDGLLDLVVCSSDPDLPPAFYRNRGDGTFEDRTEAAGLKDQSAGFYCVQTDYNNDGRMDLFIVRGGWLPWPVRPSLLRNNGDGTFTDVTRQAGLMNPLNATTACWADFDNDGHLDLFVPCEKSHNRLYRNKGDGTFEEVAVRAGVGGVGRVCRGACWGDYDGDGYPDLFVNNLDGPPHLYHNNRDGTFTDVAAQLGVVGPTEGFSCWFWDYDNDGWLDLYATAYRRDLNDAVRGLLGQPHQGPAGRLYRNQGGRRFQDVTREAGLDLPLPVMGSNFADFDNDGYLDFYVGTGWPALSAIMPKRLFRNVAGRRFADITLSSGTGHLQKGHAVACGDWDRDGSVDLFEQMGGAAPGDRYHNVLYQNPGQGNNWLSVKLVGKKTNRAAIGARIKAVTAATSPLTVYRHVTSGSSFGANPLEQTIGLARADRVATLEVYWPTSGTTQVFHDLAANQAIEVTEFASTYRKLDRKRIPLPQ